MSTSIRLHEKLGLNPKLGICPLCKEENGEVILPGAAVEEEYPRHMYGTPCKKCLKLLDDQGHTAFINTATMDSCVIKREAIQRMYGEDAKKMEGRIVASETTFWKEAT